MQYKIMQYKIMQYKIMQYKIMQYKLCNINYAIQNFRFILNNKKKKIKKNFLKILLFRKMVLKIKRCRIKILKINFK